MLHRPRFRSCFRVEQIDGEGVLILTETDYRLLEGHVERLAPLLTGDLTTAEIQERVRGEIPPAELRYTLGELEKRGYIVEAGRDVPDGEAAYWEGMHVDSAQAAEQLREGSVTVTTVGDLSADPMNEALKSLGVGLEPDGDLEVILTDDYLREELAECNREALRERSPFLLVKPVGTVPWIGPLVVPGRTACWACLAQRLRLNRPAETYLREHQDTTSPVRPAGSLPTTEKAAVHLAATQAAQWIAGAGIQAENVTGTQNRTETENGNEGRTGAGAPDNTLVSLDTRTLETRAHPVVRRPQCPQCGEPPADRAQSPRPPTLKSRPKSSGDEAGYRTVSPEATLRAYEHHVSPLTGAVRELERLSDPDDELVHSYRAGHAVTSRFAGFDMVRKNLRDVSGGTGRTDLQARVSALCEALERYSGIYQAERPTRIESYSSLGDEAIPPNRCMRFSERQYRDREQRNARHDRLAHWIPEPLDEERAIEWTPVWSLSDQTFKYLPTAYCFYGYPPEKSRFCRADSNGNAAGNTREEAILQGFLELVERDAVAVWWYNRLSMPGVDLDGFEEPYFEELRAYYRSIGRELWVLDLTMDLGVPVFAALSRRVDADRENILVGFGAHLNARLGILRALTELNQVLPVALQREEGGSDGSIRIDERLEQWLRAATLETQPYLAPRSGAAETKAEDHPERGNDDLLEDIQHCRSIVEERGLELLVLDQTRPDVGLPVVKVIVPGLRHYWPRFGSGRLYTVPVREQFRDEPLSEDQLNPVPFVF